jgi:formate dehydrogenase iron-sulfur subunit
MVSESVLETEARAAADLTNDLLEEQGDLSAVTRFAQWHEAHTEPALAPVYRRLMPLTKPGAGQQYAFEVDLDKCSGCKACVSACHSLNGLDEGEAWRTTGLLVSKDWRQPYQQTITTACHHCVDPACLNGCPVLAYDKDPLTGIVRHLDDQCIGCQYCVLKCPYEAPKYSKSRGIVRKCDMCSHRLVAGEAPACVQACPNEAIRITLVEKQTVATSFRPPVTVLPGSSPRILPVKNAGDLPECSAGANPFLPGSPAPAYTLPATRFISSRPLPDSASGADHEELRAQPPHTPLVFMLVFSQLSVGLQLGAFLLGIFFLPVDQAAKLQVAQSVAALVTGLAGLLIGALHLGRPLGAWRAFLGLRKSWLSRELVAFGLFVPLVGVNAALGWVPPSIALFARTPLSLTALMVGLLAVFCSAMVYHDTQRDFWRLPFSLGKFFGSMILLGAAGTTLMVGFRTHLVPSALLIALTAIIPVGALCKVALEHKALRHAADDNFLPLHKTALLLTGRFGLFHRCQMALLVGGGIFLPGLLALEMALGAGFKLSPGLLGLQFGLLFALCLLAELAERRLFFVAVQPVNMPGTIAS